MAAGIKLNQGPWYSGLETTQKLGIEYPTLLRYVNDGWLPDRRSNKVGQFMFNDEDITQCRIYRQEAKTSADTEPEPIQPARPMRMYSQLEAASYLRVGLNNVPGLVAMGLLPDHRNEPRSRGQWLFSQDELDRCLEMIRRAGEDEEAELQQQRARREKAMPQVGESVMDQKPEEEAQPRKVRAQAIRETSPTGGRWANPSGKKLTAEEVAGILGLSVETVKSYCVPSVGWKLPDRRAKRGEPFYYYESDIEEFNRSRQPFVAYTTLTPEEEKKIEKKGSEEPMNTAPVTPHNTALEVVVERPKPTLPAKIVPLSNLFDYLSAVHGATDIVAVEKLAIKVEVTISNVNALSERILAPIDFHVVPNILVWDVYMTTADKDGEEPSPYQVVFANGTYYVTDLERATEPGTKE